ncbi:hypothetical protein PVK06_044354 [Gossypium arboreum]|uniref:RNase H type-1 domain-containing protein n=1 Tax=Gossypium arboreum TaxID=29729 RepID=A0ABR0MR23_GOSAR|nr:hypothetical protein PVK06_044354 [Gossypium arboreum]
MLLRRFFSYSLKDWLTINLRNEFGLVFQEFDWRSLFGILCWKIWKQRCLCVFQDVSFNKDHILHSSWSWVKALKFLFGRPVESTRRRNRCRKWSPPPSGSIKLNTDGARNLVSRLAASAVVARDEFGNLVCGVGRNIGRCSVEQVELWEIYDGFSMEWDAQWRDVVETDCALVIKGINGDSRGYAHRDLVIRIWELRS